MALVMEYAAAVGQLREGGFRSLYHNSGAFGLPGESVSRGWVGGEDLSIRETARPLLRRAEQAALPGLFISLWKSSLAGPVWLMPKSHWAYELEFGNGAWLTPWLDGIGIDSAALRPRNDAAPVVFEETETAAVEGFIAEAVARLAGSDFAFAFPGRATVCTVHHHKQLWWTTLRSEVAAAMDRLVADLI